jgi:hypothetical protein
MGIDIHTTNCRCGHKLNEDGIGGLVRYLEFVAERLNQNDPVDFEFSKGENFHFFFNQMAFRRDLLC